MKFLILLLTFATTDLLLAQETGQESDTLEIRTKNAIIWEPDSAQISQAKKEFGDDFYTGADDYLYYVHVAEKYLQEKGLKTIRTDKKYLKFYLDNGSTFYVNKSDMELLWNIIFFDPLKHPKIIDLVMAEMEYENYFGQK